MGSLTKGSLRLDNDPVLCKALKRFALAFFFVWEVVLMNSKTYTVTLIPGDGTGPELCEVVKRVVAATGVSVAWEVVEAGADAVSKHGTPLPDHVLASVRK